MQIKVQPTGNIQQYFPKVEMIFDIKEDATLVDLYNEMGRTMGDDLPRSIWNHEKNRFRGPIIVSSNKVILKKECTSLHNNQLIELKRFLIGG